MALREKHWTHKTEKLMMHIHFRLQDFYAEMKGTTFFLWIKHSQCCYVKSAKKGLNMKRSAFRCRSGQTASSKGCLCAYFVL